MYLIPDGALFLAGIAAMNPGPRHIRLVAVDGATAIHQHDPARIDRLRLFRAVRIGGRFADPAHREFGAAAKLLRRGAHQRGNRSEEHTSELQSLLSSSYAAFCL